MYTTLKSTVHNISFVQGISTPEVDYNYRSLYIFDDLLKDAIKMRIYVNFIQQGHTIVIYRSFVWYKTCTLKKKKTEQ